ncbi:MAG: response regulator transcription factor [Thermoleophilia bacterium]
MPRVLVVEDGELARAAMRRGLRRAGFEVLEAADAEHGLRLAALRQPDLALLDVVLPASSGIEVCRSLREWSAMPILMVSAVRDPETVIGALEAGADDYVARPVTMEELVARIRAVIRRVSPARDGIVVAGDLRIDLDRHEVRRDGVPVPLTAREFRLLAELARRLDRLVPYEDLLTAVWGPPYRHETHYLRVYVRRLRAKLEPDPVRPRRITTETGVWYRLNGGV